MAVELLKRDVHDLGTLPLIALRRWLRGNWALLFSHADDFACYGFEVDRWLVHVGEAFAAADVRPLVVTPSASGQNAGWPGEIGGLAVDLRPNESRRYPVAPGTHEHALLTAVRGSTGRFVMMLDDSLRLRRTFAYAIEDRLPSLIDLVGMAASVRTQVRRAFPVVAVRRSSAGSTPSDP
jgi:hypothetical protein